MSTIASVSGVRQDSDEAYYELEKLIRARVASFDSPLFFTDAGDMFATFLGNIPKDARSHYTCRCCQRFVERYGGLVRIQPDGQARSLLWWGPRSEAACDLGFFRDVIHAMDRRIERARVRGVFLSSDAKWGVPENIAGRGSKYVGYRWTHLSGTPPMKSRFADRPTMSADQAMAEKSEDYGMLNRAIVEYPMAVVDQAVRVLEADALDRSEKTLGAAKWLLDLHRRIASKRGRERDNIVWLAVATAPPGFCHVKTNMISVGLTEQVADSATCSVFPTQGK